MNASTYVQPRTACVLLAIALQGCGGSTSGQMPPEGPRHEVTPPPGVRALPSYNSSWKFIRKDDGSVEVDTNLDSDVEGRGVAMRVCELSVEWFNPGLHDIEQPTEVTVLGSDRDPLVHRPVDGFCERA